MKALGIAMLVIGYALFYTGASNLFTNGQGWGFLQSLLNKGNENQSGGSKLGTAAGNVLGDLVGGLAGKLKPNTTQ